MRISTTFVALLASGALSAPTEAHNRARDVVPFLPEPYNITVPPIANITNGTDVNTTATPTDLTTSEIVEREVESSEIEGMTKAKVKYYRALAMSQASDQFKRNFPSSPWNASNYNTSQPKYPLYGNPECRGHGHDSCSVFGGDDKCDSFCKKCPGPQHMGKHGQGKCEGFLLFKSCHCSYE